MKSAGRILLLLVLTIGSCKRSSSDDGSPPSPPGPPPPVTITGPSPALPAVLRDFTITPLTFTATGSLPITWTVTGGTLTPGLGLSTAGLLTGTPTTAGSFLFTVTATDANGSTFAIFSQDVVLSLAETEPNNLAATADAIPVGGAAKGTLGTDDVDFWSFSAAAGQFVEVEFFGVRRDFSSWDGNANLPQVSLVGTDGASFLVGHDIFSAGTVGWFWGQHDLDIPRFRIPATGTYFVRIDPYFSATDGGDYAFRVNDVSPPSIQAESENNDTAGTADSIIPGMIRATRVDGNDDFFSFTVSGPTLVYLEITAYRNGVFGNGGVPDNDYYDPLIELRDTDGLTVLATNDDVFFYDSALHYHIALAGTYFLRVSESGAGTDGDSEYFITYTATPVGSLTETEGNDDAANANPIAYGNIVSGAINGGEVDVFSFSGTAGDMVRLFWFEFGASQTASDFVDLVLMTDDVNFVRSTVSYTGTLSLACVRAILPATGTYYIRATPVGGLTSYTFQLTRFKGSAFETEGNDSTGTADAIPVMGSRVAGIISAISDVDVFVFSAEAGELVTLSIYAGIGSYSDGFYNHSGYGSALAPDLELLNSVGAVIGTTLYAGTNYSGESVTNGLATSELTFVAPVTGTFYVRVSSFFASGDADHLYLLEKR